MADEEISGKLNDEDLSSDVTPEELDDTESEPGEDVEGAVAAPARKSFTDKKGTATRKRSDATEVEEKRTTPIQFTKESIGELKKVVWPTQSQLSQYFLVVLVFVLFIIAYVSMLDIGFGAALLWIFGGGQ